MEKDAQTIAEILIKTNTDLRGNLLKRVSEILIARSQGFTGNLINETAEKYGINPKTR